jgi:hypothetical protein
MKKRNTHYAKTVVWLLLIGGFGIVSFYILRTSAFVMTLARDTISRAWRFCAGSLSSLIPFSVYEVGGILLAIFALYWITKSIVLLFKRQPHRVFFRRIVPMFVAGVWVWGLFLWVWCANYYAKPYYADSLPADGGVSVAELQSAAEYFRDGANAYAARVARDSDGHYAEDTTALLARANDVYATLAEQIPIPAGSSARVKPMFFSKLMSRMQFTGVYMAYVGEANVNIDAPAALIPATAAHELAHARGVAREDEANFFGIAACVTSGDDAFVYSGYLDGLIYLSNALYSADPERYFALAAGYSDLVRLDLADNSAYWDKYKDTTAIAVMATNANDAYLKSYGQTLGNQSYGKCVDLLTAWRLTIDN